LIGMKHLINGDSAGTALWLKKALSTKAWLSEEYQSAKTQLRIIENTK